VVDARGIPLALRLTKANVNDSQLFEELLDAGSNRRSVSAAIVGSSSGTLPGSTRSVVFALGTTVVRAITLASCISAVH
jgi:hypothetical protein